MRTIGLSVVRSVSLSVCVQDYWKSNQSISLKLGGVMIGPSNWKNWLTLVVIQSRIRIPRHFATSLTIAE